MIIHVIIIDICICICICIIIYIIISMIIGSVSQSMPSVYRVAVDAFGLPSNRGLRLGPVKIARARLRAALPYSVVA